MVGGRGGFQDRREPPPLQYLPPNVVSQQREGHEAGKNWKRVSQLKLPLPITWAEYANRLVCRTVACVLVRHDLNA